MIKNWDGLRNNLIFIFFIVGIINCYTPPIRKIPEFNYDKLLEIYYKEKIKEPFPVIVQPSEEEDFSISEDGYMVFSSNLGGNFDLWLRDLNSILKIKILEHPAKQYRPFIKKLDNNLYILLYVSNDKDINGDIYLTYLNPKQILNAYINKRRQINLWDYSISVSNLIEQYFNNIPDCKGKYTEDFPFISYQNDSIYFISNRCYNKFHLWKVPLKDQLPEGKPEVVLNKEIYFPSINKNYILFNILKNNEFTSEIGLWDIKNNQLKIIKPKILNKELTGLSLKPKFRDDDKTIYFIYIHSDTNGNNKLDLNDQSTLLKMDLEGNIISQVLPDGNRLFDYSIITDSNNNIKNKIFYISDIYMQKDIFLNKVDGSIPKMQSPIDQYLYAQNFYNSNYDLILQSVIEYFYNKEEYSKEYNLIEGDVLYDLITYLDKENKKEKLVYYKDFYNFRQKENPYLDIFFQLKAFQKNRSCNVNRIKDIEKQFFRINNTDLEKNYFYFKIAEICWNTNKQLSFNYFNLISKNFKFFPKVNYYLFLYNLENKKNHPEGIQVSYLKEAIKDLEFSIAISDMLIDIFRKYSIDFLKNYEFKIQEEFVKNYISYVIAEKLYFENNLKESLEKLNGIKNIDFPETKYLKLKILKIKIKIYKRLGWENELLSARSELINNYDKKFKIQLDEEEIKDLIYNTNQFVEKYRKSAQSIYQNIEKSIYDINIQNNLIEIDVLNRDNLNDFCAPNSLAKKLIDDYNYIEYIKRYANLCKNYNTYKDNEKIPIELAFEANQLMYLASYAYANLINIMFINLHNAEIYKEYHRKWSIFYHRLKIDLATERFNYLLDWQEKTALFISKEKVTNLLIEKDPFDGTIFNDLLYGYREVAAKMAQETFEYSVLYGHAYTLIRKSIEREKFYDSLFLKGYNISNDELIKRKRNILLELKEAEYQLQYILTLDPTNEDAALLLTYLYGYIDYRKDLQILNKPGYIDRLLRFLTKRQPKKLTDRIFFRTLYSTTFPDNLYEKNIDILESTIAIRKLKNLPISPEIYLNVANNYYKIYNYKKAIEYYRILENRDDIFENSLQSGLYYFYYAKSNFYENHYDQAYELFDKSYSILYKIYQEKLKEYSIFKIIKIDTILDKINILKQKQFPIERELQNLKLNLITIQLYKAIVKYYSEDYSSAIQELSNIVEELQDYEKIKNYNVYNFIALNYYLTEDFINSFRWVQMALQEASKESLKRDDDIFLPQTVGGRFLGLFMNFGEDFAIIGDGRIPHQISSLRSYEVSLGLMRNIYTSLGDVKKIIENIEEKKKIIKSLDFDVRLGKETYIYLLNTEGNLYFQLKQFEKSLNSFEEASKIALENNFSKEYFTNFKNMYYVFFDELEYSLYLNANKNSQYLNKIKQFQKKLSSFKREYYKIRETEYINIRKTENPDYKLTEEERIQLTKQVNLELIDFYHIEALLIYYESKFLHHLNLHKKSIELLKVILKEYKNYNISRSYYSIYLNYLRILFDLKQITNETSYEDILNEINTIYFDFIEFGLNTELIELNHILGDIYFIKKDYDTAISYYKEVFLQLDKNIYLYNRWDKIEVLLNKYIYCLWQKKLYREIVLIKEQFRYFIIHHLFFINKIQFSEIKLTKLFNEIHQNIQQIKYFDQLYTERRIDKKDVKGIKEKLEGLTNQLLKRKNVLIKEVPELKNLIEFSKENIFKNNDKNQYIYIFGGIEKLCINIHNNYIISTQIKDTLDPCIKEYPQNIVIIPDKWIYFSELKKYYEDLKKKNYYVALRSTILDKMPVYIENVKDLDYSKNINFLNQDSNSIIKNQDIIELSLLPIQYLLNLSEDGLGKYFKDKPLFSTVNIGNTKEYSFWERDQKTFKIVSEFDSLWLTYDILRHLGISILNDKNQMRWGIDSYNEENFSEYRKNLSKEYFKKGLEIFKNNPEESLKYFSLANSYDNNIKNKIYILASLIRIQHPEKEKYENEVRKLLENNKEYLLQFYVILIRSYTYLKNYNKLMDIVNELNNLNLNKKKIQAIKNSIYVLQELSKINPDFISIEAILNSQEFDTSFVDTIVEELYKHGFYYLSLKLSKKYSNLEEISIKNQIQLYMLQKLQPNWAYILSKEFSDPELILWQNIYQNKFDYIIDYLRNHYVYNSRVLSTQIKFYQYLKETFLDKFYLPEKFVCKENTDCTSILDLEKKVMFFYYLNQIPFDNNDSIKLNVNVLIDHFYQESCFKGNLYLHKLISKYIKIGDYNSAFELYQKYKDRYSCIWNQEGNNYITDIALPLFVLKGLQYKIDDKLIFKFLAKEELKVLAEDFIRLLKEPEEKISVVLNKIHWDKIPVEYHESIYDLLLLRFLKEKDFENFQNISFIKDTKSKNYKNYVSLIKNNLSDNEDWINIIDFNHKFYYCSVRNSCKELNFKSNYLKKMLSRYIYEKKYYKSGFTKIEELIDIYSKIFGKNQNSLTTYYWISGIHKFAPFIVKNNSYFVYSVEKFRFHRINNPFHESYSCKIGYLNFDKEKIKYLNTLIDFNNQFIKNKNICVVSSRENNEYFNIFVQHIPKNREFSLIFSEVDITIDMPEESYGIFIFMDWNHILNFINILYHSTELDVNKKFYKIYKEFLKNNYVSVYFTKPYTNQLLK